MEEKRGSFACPTCGNDLPIVAKQSVVGVWCETCRHFVEIVWVIKPKEA